MNKDSEWAASGPGRSLVRAQSSQLLLTRFDKPRRELNASIKLDRVNIDRRCHPDGVGLPPE
jgi:hypothetical protein